MICLGIWANEITHNRFRHQILKTIGFKNNELFLSSGHIQQDNQNKTNYKRDHKIIWSINDTNYSLSRGKQLWRPMSNSSFWRKAFKTGTPGVQKDQP